MVTKHNYKDVFRVRKEAFLQDFTGDRFGLRHHICKLDVCPYVPLFLARYLRNDWWEFTLHLVRTSTWTHR